MFLVLAFAKGPTHDDSLTRTSEAASKTPSAGIRAPVSSSTTSPTTTEVTGTDTSTPSRSTRAVAMAADSLSSLRNCSCLL